MHGFSDRGLFVPKGRFMPSGRFGRMFPALRSLKDFKPGAEALGKAGGPMDGGNPPPTDTSQNNPRIKAGYTFLGQFIDHDLTLDTTSVLEQQIDVNATHNFRTAAFELDSLYGSGPADQPYLYMRDGSGRLLLGPGDNDLHRNGEERAIIGDPRNDENLIVAQLHLLFQKFHNKVVTGHTGSAKNRFEEAQRLVRWHYQWIVLHEFLPRTVGSHTAARVLNDNPFEYDGEPFMPVEFSVAAYRFGHSQVRPGYRLRTGAAAGLFPDQPDAPPSTGDLRGGRKIPPELLIDWATFFGKDAQPSKLVDTKLSTVLLKLPNSVIPAGVPDKHRSLATRNLQRGLDAFLPAGQAVASRLRISNPLTESEIWKGVQGGEGPAPLWFYILREGEARANGHRLAGAGAEIVARVFVALMQADRASFLAQEPDWKPHLGPKKGSFSVTDLINFTLGTNVPGEDLAALPGDDAAAPAPKRGHPLNEDRPR